jgi:hypothetical protein
MRLDPLEADARILLTTFYNRKDNHALLISVLQSMPKYKYYQLFLKQYFLDKILWSHREFEVQVTKRSKMS